MALDVRTLINTVEQTLWDIVSLGYLVRRAPVATLAALRAAPAQTVSDRDLVYVTAEDRLYRWTAASTAADDGLAVIAPTTPPYAPASTNGRWLRVSSPATFGPNRFAPLQSKQTGYARSVILYQGEGGGGGPKEVAESVFGQSPAILIQWLGDDADPRSIRPGALYWDNLEFQILVYSESLRGRPWSRLGSPIGAELAKDPGLNRMIGDIRYLLAGIETGVEGIDSVEIGRSDIISQDAEERIFIAGVQVIVRTSWTIPDEDLEAMRIRVDTLFPVTYEALDKFDPLNYVASGLTVAVGPGLTRTPAPGTVFIAGTAIAVTPAPVTFAASSDVYRDLKPDNTITYVTVPAGSKAPAVTSGALRVGVTTTDAGSIVQDKILCSYARPLQFPSGSMLIE